MGPAVVDTGAVEILIISAPVEPHGISCLGSLGIGPTQKKCMAPTSRMHWRAGCGAMARGAIPCNGLGATTSDYTLRNFRPLRRPRFPLDAI
jgi:microcystin degradation protein MlrC